MWAFHDSATVVQWLIGAVISCCCTTVGLFGPKGLFELPSWSLVRGRLGSGERNPVPRQRARRLPTDRHYNRDIPATPTTFFHAAPPRHGACAFHMARAAAAARESFSASKRLSWPFRETDRPGGQAKAENVVVAQD